jgi:hypothetical protein
MIWMDIEYTPPFDTRLEKYIIGAMIYDPQCIVEVVDMVKPHFFTTSPIKSSSRRLSTCGAKTRRK